MDRGKEAFFGGLPETLFGQIVAFLQGKATPGAPGVTAAEATAALVALASLTKEEHAAAASTVQVREIDAIFKAIELQAEFAKVQAAPGGLPLVTELAKLAQLLDTLALFWYGK